MSEKALTCQEVAERLAISRQQVYTLVHSGKLVGRRVGKGISNIRIMESDLQLFLEDSRIVPARPVKGGPALRMPYKNFF